MIAREEGHTHSSRGFPLPPTCAVRAQVEKQGVGAVRGLFIPEGHRAPVIKATHRAPVMMAALSNVKQDEAAATPLRETLLCIKIFVSKS